MDYKAYERKMNSIYDMVGEGKYKVRRRPSSLMTA